MDSHRAVLGGLYTATGFPHPTSGSNASRPQQRRRPRSSSPLPGDSSRAGATLSHSQRIAAADTEPRFSLNFILDQDRTETTTDESRPKSLPHASTRLQTQLSSTDRSYHEVPAPPTRRNKTTRSETVAATARAQTRSRRKPRSNPHERTTAAKTTRATSSEKRKAEATRDPKTKNEKRLARKCTVDDCTNYTINNGLCFRHGGGKKCSLEGCGASAKVFGLCWKHGGSIQCVVDGCDRRGKSRGLCWSHGGGTVCGHENCGKVAVSKGFCWAHGGGKRCAFEGCQRPAYERTFNYCPTHFARFENGDEIMEV